MPIIAQMYPPRRMLMYRGSRAAMSAPAGMEFAHKLVPNVASAKAKAMKKTAGLLSNFSSN